MSSTPSDPKDRLSPLMSRLDGDICRDQFRFLGRVPAEALVMAERAIGVLLPTSYKQFVREMGLVEFTNERLMEPSRIAPMRSVLRRRWPPLPRRLIPFAEGEVWIRFGRTGPTYLCFDLNRSILGESEVVSWTPGAARGERCQRPWDGACEEEVKEMTFEDWLEQQIRCVEESIDPPQDWRNDAAWERYWGRVLADSREASSHSLGGFHCGHTAALKHLPLLRERSLRRVLFAGNGISLEPHCFVHLGFDVTALDVSPVASAFVHEQTLSAKQLSRFLACYHSSIGDYGETVLKLDLEGSLRRVEEEHRPGGRLRVDVASLFDYAPGEPFDAVYSNRAFQGFPAADRSELARRFHAWLRPGGVCLLETINLRHHTEEVDEAFRQAGFFVYGEGFHERTEGVRRRALGWRGYLRRRLRGGRSAAVEEMGAELDRLWKGAHQEAMCRLDGGEKMLVPWHGSG